MKFTRQTVTALTLPEGKKDHIFWDDALPGFGLRLRAGGKRTWIVQYRHGTKQRRVSLGRIDAVNLDVARNRAKEILAKVELGADPQAEKAETKARASLTLGVLVERYLERAEKGLKPRSFEEVERHLKKHWKPLHRLPLDKIRRADVANRVSELAKSSGLVAANRARVALSGFFTWAMGQGLAEANPVIGTMPAAPERARDRVLTDAELAAVWRTCGDDHYGRIVRLLILTGQRREEVGAMRWDEIDLAKGLWTIPAERTKNHRPHEVPLSPMAREIINDMSRPEGRDLIFGEAEGPFQGWSKAKAALDKRMAKVGAKVGPWRLHDLRRTAATRMADCGVQPHVIEAVLNHVSGHKAGVAGIYNRSLYAAEKREALNRWARHVQSLFEPPKVGGKRDEADAAERVAVPA